VWSDEKVIEATKDFVCALDEVWRLQRGKDAESLHFQAMADKGHYGGGGGTRQGIYVLTADGTLLAASNHLSAAKALETLTTGLEAWKKTTPTQRTLPSDWTLPRKRWEDSLPPDAVILISYNADLGAGAQRERLNRDHVWFTVEEARGWLPAEPTEGRKHVVSKLITERIAQFHLVDNVRGQTLPFAAQDVAGTVLRTTVTAREGNVVSFTIEGETQGETDGSWLLGENDWKPKTKYPRGVTTTVNGVGRYDTATGRFLQLEFAAIGERTGRTNLNGRKEGDVGPEGIGWIFELAPDRASSRIAPAFVDIYGADWIVDPR